MNASERSDSTTASRFEPAAALTESITGHAGMGSRIFGHVDSFASHAELARTLLDGQRQSIIATLTQSGHPFASRAPFTLLDDGSPIVCISDLAEHTQNIRRDPRSTMLVSETITDDSDPLAHARVTLIGSFMPYDPSPEQIDTHAERHPQAKTYMGLDDFSWWRLDILSARFIGGYGLMGWVSSDEFHSSAPDPIIPHSGPMCDHLNSDHRVACLAIVHALPGAADTSAAHVTAIDRYGITLHIEQHGRHAEARVAFAEPLHSPSEVRAATVELVAQAKRLTRVSEADSRTPQEPDQRTRQ